ncbi:ABC-F family ATP-binding cassette domain-containing protein [Rhodobacteraceae bacterium NNCM2]|nr:ABC-F family ATP-binding cassette domain-containing protein [Coraliihabitans acroporae]
MSIPPILTLTDITLGWGGKPLFEGLSLAINPGDRLCVVGRNGSGKSTLMKLAAGLIEPDGGERFVKPGSSVSYLPQEPDFTGFATLGAYAAADLDPAETWRAEMALDGLKQSGAVAPADASGGERRRAALARIIAAEADLMLLDEPTNHLDIQAIEWLEGHLAESRNAFALISHDRAFLTRLARETLWLDRGEARRNPKGFAAFEEWRDKVMDEEEAQRHKLDRLIKQEAHWAVYGISARRTRNQGRLRRLEGLRQQRRDQVGPTGKAAMDLSSGEKSGKLVIEAKNLAKSFGDKVIVRDFSLRLARGERLALVGPNGTGKTTLLKMLIGELAPDSGSIRIGSTVRMAVFDQNRAALDPEKTLWESLTEDKLLGVKGSNDQIMVRGRPKHVVGYLKEFLFNEKQARGPVKALSGGERARLLLARIMARESNFLVLDEPTNDLDIETLDLLQELVADFDGTVLLVSHDRDFLDRVATTTIAMEGGGSATVYPGGWSDYQAQRKADAPAESPRRDKPKTAAPPPPKPQAAALSGKQQHRLKQLPDEIARLEGEIARLEAFLADPTLYETAPAKFAKATEGLAERQRLLEEAEEEWLTLEELNEKSA